MIPPFAAIFPCEMTTSAWTAVVEGDGRLPFNRRSMVRISEAVCNYYFFKLCLVAILLVKSLSLEETRAWQWND